MGAPEKKYVAVELSLEHETFPAAELEALSAMADFTPVKAGRRLALIRCVDPDFTAGMLCSRLAFSHSVSLLLGEYPSWQELLEHARHATQLLAGGTFRVRIATRDRELKSRVPSMERELGSVLSGFGRVDIDNAATEFRVFCGEGRFLLSKLYCAVDRRSIDRRSVSNRVFFSPVSLPPRYAKGLLNLCAVSEGDRVLDPFCGTGGIVMEAALIGADAVGTDIDRKMVEGTMSNLRQLGIGERCDLHTLDVSDVPSLGTFDAIITDPPYGRSSYMKGERPASLYARAMKAFARCLRSGGRLGIVLPDASLADAGDEFVLQRRIEQRVHRSLTRNYMVFVRK